MSKRQAFLPVNNFINSSKKGKFSDEKLKEGLFIFKNQMNEFIEYKYSCTLTARMNLEILKDIETELNSRL